MNKTEVPLSFVVDMALGSPETGCCNLNLLHVCITRIIKTLKIQDDPVSASEMGLQDNFDFYKETKNRTNDMWTMMKMKKEVQTGLEGVDRLFEIFSDMINGETNVVTWGALDEHLHMGEAKTHEELKKTLRDLKDAKDFFGEDKEKIKDIEKKEEEIMERKRRFEERDDRASRRSMPRMSIRNIFPDDDDDDEAEEGSISRFASVSPAPDSVKSGPTSSPAPPSASPKGNLKSGGDDKEKRGITIAQSTPTPSPKPPPTPPSKQTPKTTPSATPNPPPRPPGRPSSAPPARPPAGHTSPARPSSARQSIFYEDDGAEAQTTLAGLGQMALLAGGLEERLNVHDAQIKILVKFRNAMVQGDLVGKMMKMLASGGLDVVGEMAAMLKGRGLEALRHIVQAEQEEGGGVDAVKHEIEDLTDHLAANQEETRREVEDVRREMDEIIETSTAIKTEILRQQTLIKELTAKVSDLSHEIRILKEQVVHLEQVKADRLWAIMELNNKMNMALLPTLVRQEQFQENLREVGASLADLADKQTATETLLEQHVTETFNALNLRLPIRVFDEFRDAWTSRLEKLQRMLYEILGITNGEEDGAFLKLFRYHCGSCDRPVRMVKQAKCPTLPAMAGLNSSKSARPYAVFGQSQIRRNIRNNNAMNDAGKVSGTATTLMSTAALNPSFGINVRGYNDAVVEQRRVWQERRERSVMLKEDPFLVDRNLIKQNDFAAYHKSAGPGVTEDVWRVERTDGGVHTVTRASQRRAAHVDFNASFTMPVVVSILETPGQKGSLDASGTLQRNSSEPSISVSELNSNNCNNNDNTIAKSTLANSIKAQLKERSESTAYYESNINPITNINGNKNNKL